MGKILLEGMEFFSYHGCFQEERIIGTKFVINLIVELTTDKAEISDRLEDTLNYSAIYQIVKQEMEKKSYLIEHVARRIITALIHEFNQIGHIEIKISKLNPPMGGKMKQVSFISTWP